MKIEAIEKNSSDVTANLKLFKLALSRAIYKAEIFKQPLISKENGKIKELTPEQMKRKIKNT